MWPRDAQIMRFKRPRLSRSVQLTRRRTPCGIDNDPKPAGLTDIGLLRNRLLAPKTRHPAHPIVPHGPRSPRNYADSEYHTDEQPSSSRAIIM